MKKNKLLICMLLMSMVLTMMTGMKSSAEELSGETTASDSGLQDENGQRLEETTGMGADGEIYPVGGSAGLVDGEDNDAGITLFSMRSAVVKVVNFNTKGNAVTTYTNEKNNASGYTNGAYGADAAYLGTTSDGKVRFMLSGVTGIVDADQVQLLDYDEVSSCVSYYAVSGGQLLHYISQNLNQAPVSAVNNGPAPYFLQEGITYYSYDGTYFYTDYAVMTADYQNGAAGNSAVNAGNPFTNYFQFLDMNTSSAYSGEQLEEILSYAMQNAYVDPASSLLTNTGTTFVECQNAYNVNALLSLSIAVNESGWGTSYIAQTKNNIFGIGAYDSSAVYSSKNYGNVRECIQDFMGDLMQNGYLSSWDWRNNGEYLGNKGSGINVSYASDPYWGEKAASIAWNLDKIGGYADYYGLAAEPDGDDVINGTPTTPEPDGDAVTDGTQTTPESDGDAVTDGTQTTPEPDGNTGTDGTQTTPEPDGDAGTDGTQTTPEPDGDTGTDGTQTTPEPDGNTGTDGTQTTPEPDGNTGTDGTQTAPETDGNAGTDMAPAVEEVQTPSSESGSVSVGQAAEADSGSTLSVRSVTALSNKVYVNTKLSEGADIKADQVLPNTERYTTLVSAGEISGKTVLGVYDIKLTGTMEGEAELTFYVGSEYEGRNVIILHYNDESSGSYEVYKGTVRDGQVTITVNSFSPYVVALDSNISSAPKTGDSAAPVFMIVLWCVLIIVSIAAIIIFIIKINHRKR